MPGFFNASTLAASRPTVSKIPKCGACKLYRHCHSPKMQPTGKGRKRILLVAEAPGATEDERGIQLIGKSGQLLEQTFREVGIDMRRDCWLTNSVICRPRDNETPDNKIIEWCRPNLFNTIDKIKPDVIICFGAVAVKSLIGHVWREDVGPMARWAGFCIPSQYPNAWICPTYHPAYLLRQNDPVLDLHFKQHLAQAISKQGKPWDKLPNYEQSVQCVLDPAKAASKLRKLVARRPEMVAVDYETNMLKPDCKEAQIVSCAVSDGETTLSYPWHGEAIQATKELLVDPEIGKIAQNLKFEERWTCKEFGEGVVPWIWDTMVSAHVLDNRQGGITGLKFQAFSRLGQTSYDDHIAPYLHQKNSNKKNRIRELDLRQLLLYGGYDALFEILVAKQQMEEIKCKMKM